MTENPHDNEDLPTPREKLSEKEKDEEQKDARRKDQKKRSYYYDDAHGYEVYKEDEDEGEEI